MRLPLKTRAAAGTAQLAHRVSVCDLHAAIRERVSVRDHNVFAGNGPRTKLTQTAAFRSLCDMDELCGTNISKRFCTARTKAAPAFPWLRSRVSLARVRISVGVVRIAA